MAEKAVDVMGVGSPIVDTLARVSEAHLASVRGGKGGMVLVDAAEMGRLLADLEPGSLVEAPGGSAGNTTFTLARLGLRTRFLGKIGRDPLGRFYRERFMHFGGDPVAFKEGDEPNAQCLSLVTPDAERTMRTCLGAAATLGPDELSPADFAGCRLAHIEGYVLFNRALAVRTLQCAREAGCEVSLDLASYEVVGASADILPDLLRDYVDIVLANEAEAAAFPGEGKDPEAQARALGQLCRIAVVKLGAAGSLIMAEGRLTRVPPVWVDRVVDTTGAGDQWAAGFLYGYLRGRDLATAGAYGSLLGAETVQFMGAEIPEDRLQAAREKF